MPSKPHSIPTLTTISGLRSLDVSTTMAIPLGTQFINMSRSSFQSKLCHSQMRTLVLLNIETTTDKRWKMRRNNQTELLTSFLKMKFLSYLEDHHMEKSNIWIQ